MVHIQDTKFLSITPPAAIVDNTSYTTAVVDTDGFEYCTIVAYLGATDIAMVALKVQESAAADMTGATDVTGLVCGTSTTIDGATSTLPSATDDNKFVVFEINTNVERKRYLDLVATAGDGTLGTFMTAFAILSRARMPVRTAAERGVLQVLRV